MKKAIFILIRLLCGCSNIDNKTLINKINELELKISQLEKRNSILKIEITTNSDNINNILKHEREQNNNIQKIIEIFEVIKEIDNNQSMTNKNVQDQLLTTKKEISLNWKIFAFKIEELENKIKKP